jgi:hypothetical protein
MVRTLSTIAAQNQARTPTYTSAAMLTPLNRNVPAAKIDRGCPQQAH